MAIKGDVMNFDYTYCLNEDTCIHRRGCKRWIGNYSNDEAKELSNSKRDSYIDDKECLPDYNDIDNDNGFKLLDRFRLSDGNPFLIKEGEIKDLHFNLKGEYFYEIVAGTKKFEYRLKNDFWTKRLVGRRYGQVHFKKGYPRADDLSRIHTVPYRGYEVQTITHPLFGSEPVEVFAIYTDDSVVKF